MLYRYRLARALEMERLRTRIATDLHDDLGSTLSQIAILSEVAGRETQIQDQRSSLSEIADLARGSVDSMSDIVWAIDPEKDRLADLSHRMRRFASDLFNGRATQLQFHGPREEQNPEIETELRRHIFLIFKESLHNTLRHAACTEVEIDFRLEETWLALQVRDNGKGFDPGQANRGRGLASIEQRAGQLGGQLQIKSAPGCGTIMRLRVPFRPHLHIGEKRTYTKG
jgi:signal transduction histidine kinase